MKNSFACIALAVLMLLVLPYQALSANLAIDTSPIITDGSVDTPYTFNFIASGGTTPYTWKGSGILPPGLSMSAGGVLSGTPTSMGSYDFTVTVTDNTMATVSKPHILINVTSPPLEVPLSHPAEYGSCTTCHAAPNLPPVTTFASKPAVFTSYNYATFAFSADKTATFQCSLDGAAMASCASPVNLTSLAIGTHTFRVRATDSFGNVEFPPASYSWEVTNPSTILITTDSNLPQATVGYPYSLTLEAAYGNHVVVYSEWYTDNGTSLPAGLSLNKESGIISGAPSAAPGTYNFTLTLKVMDTDYSIRTVTKNFAIAINQHPDLAITTASLASGTEGDIYSQPIAATGGVPAYTWNVVNGSGSLPPGLILNAATGAISGEPAGFSAGTYNFDLAVTDSDSPPNTATKPFSIVIKPSLTITTPSSLPTGTVGNPYSETITTLYGTPPYLWEKRGDLPDGLSLNLSTGVISGTPNVLSFPICQLPSCIPPSYIDYSFDLKVTDANLKSFTKIFTLRLFNHPDLAITTASLPSGIINSSYSQTVSVTGGVPAYTWSLYSGNLPPGLSFNTTTGVISGTSTAVGTYNFRLKVAETHYHIAYKDLSIIIHPVLTIPTESLASGIVGTPYSAAPAASGGASPYTWTHTAGTLPPGLTFSAGVLSGSPTTAGSYSFTLTVNDSASQTASKTVSLVINPALAITTSSLPSGTVGTPYTQAATASGGVTPYSWTHTSGTLPPGLSFSAGALNGSPTTAGIYTFTLTVNDSGSQSANRSFTVEIAPSGPSGPPITIPGQPGTYSSVMGAYAAVPANGTINIAAGDLTETLDFNLTKSFSLKGGYDSATGTYTGTTTITGTMTVRSGALTVANVAIK